MNAPQTILRSAFGMLIAPLLTAPLLGAAVLLASGCAWSRVQTTQVHSNPAATVAWLGQASALSATVLLRSIDAHGESVMVTLYLWRAADGRTRLLLTKLDVDVLQVLVQPDGTFIAFAPRSGLRTSGDFNDPSLPAGLADLRLLLGEVCDGPLAPRLAKVLTRADHDNVLTGPVSAHITATVTFAPATDEISEKVLLDARGNLLYQLRYRNYQAFDDLHRPTRVEGVIADGSSFVANLRSFDALGDISAERMRVTIPDTARAVPVTNFLEHLDQ